MGRQVTETQMGEKQVSDGIAEDHIEAAEYEVKECNDEKNDGNECYGNSGKYQKTSSLALESPGVGDDKLTVPKPFKLATEKRVCASRSTAVNSEGSDAVCSPKAGSVNSPRSVKSSQMNSPTLSRRLFRGDDKKSHDNDDDCWSLTSSAAGSVKSNKFRVTVASAPVFKCTERAEKRKEFYKKLEEKHRALEEERKQFEARIKEEKDAVVKQLRKNMTYKANPVPDFYHQGPPPKPEIKKLPVTRPKSPKFNTSRRKSSSDVAASEAEEKEKIPARSVRRSTGTYKPESQTPSPVNKKIQINGRSRANATPSTPKSEVANSPPLQIDEHTSSNISVESQEVIIPLPL